jgi:glycine cleavage system H protein
MSELRGCTFPDDLLYWPENHLWFRRDDDGDGLLTVGITPLGLALSGEIILFSPKPLGVELDPGRSFALLEAGKTVFPIKTPLTVRMVAANPSLDPLAGPLNKDPYGIWLARLEPLRWETEQGSLLPFAAARAEFERIMDVSAFTDPVSFTPPLTLEHLRDY